MHAGRQPTTGLTIKICGARLLIEATSEGVTALRFLGGHPHRPPNVHSLLDLASQPLTPLLAQLIRELDEYFAGRRETFSVPLSLARVSSPFQRRVLQACARIPYGHTRTYAELARIVAGTPSAARAVGRALAVNPLPILIPCHRVIHTDGSLGGFGWGLEWKEFLLRLEGAIP